MVEFDDEYSQAFPSMPAESAPTYQLIPRGSTALLDAIGRGISEFGAELAAMPEDRRPGKVIVVIQTDGQENASREWTSRDVQDAITHQRETYNWEFVFLGANMDAVATASSLGISAHSAITYAANAAGATAVGAATSRYVSNLRSAGQTGFTDEERQAASRDQ